MLPTGVKNFIRHLVGAGTIEAAVDDFAVASTEMTTSLERLATKSNLVECYYAEKAAAVARGLVPIDSHRNRNGKPKDRSRRA